MQILSTRLEKILARFSKLKILVLGDVMLDEFVWGKVSRISPEAPVPVVEVQNTSLYPGGAANVARNLCEFTSHVSICGVIGKDEAGRKLLDLLKEKGVATGGILALPNRPTTHKTRISAQLQQTARDPRSKNTTEILPLWSYAQMVRVDAETRERVNSEVRSKLLTYLLSAIKKHDALIIEDYAKGVLDQELVTGVINEALRLGKVVAVDPNPTNPLHWSGVTVVKPNRAETFQAAGLASQPGMEAVTHAGINLQKKWQSKYLLITLGSDGMLLLEQGEKAHHAPTQAREVYDVSGAGDTAIAVFTMALAARATGIEASEIANHAAGVVVGKLGTATLTIKELRNSFLSE